MTASYEFSQFTSFKNHKFSLLTTGINQIRDVGKSTTPHCSTEQRHMPSCPRIGYKNFANYIFQQIFLANIISLMELPKGFYWAAA